MDDQATRAWILFGVGTAVPLLGRGIRTLSSAKPGTTGATLAPAGKPDSMLPEADFASRPSGTSELARGANGGTVAGSTAKTPIPEILLPDPPVGSGARPAGSPGIGFDGYTPPASATPNAPGTVRVGNSSLDVHLIDEGPAAFSPSNKNLYGTHDQGAFTAALNANGGTTVSSTKVAGTDGIYEVQYQLPGKNVATKTVFDPAVYPQADMTKMAQSASQSAINQYTASGAAGQSTIVVNVGGLQWKVGIGTGPGGIPNVKTAYPVGAASWP